MKCNGAQRGKSFRELNNKPTLVKNVRGRQANGAQAR